MFLPFLRGGEMDILPFYEAVRWMLRGGEMDVRPQKALLVFLRGEQYDLLLFSIMISA